ncbi:MAG: hypothetical protein ACD_43C00281G0007 [uncultured bacterium]|nr:MAG: hypothetical protein ACD_43C00281G0007 [uncultured bacterium]
MKIKELRDKSKAELHKLLAELKVELAATRMKVISNQEKHVNKVQVLRRDIARVLTVLNQL